MDSAGITAFSQKTLNMNSVPAKNSDEIFFYYFQMLLSIHVVLKGCHLMQMDLSYYLLNPCFRAEACSTSV